MNSICWRNPIKSKNKKDIHVYHMTNKVFHMVKQAYHMVEHSMWYRYTYHMTHTRCYITQCWHLPVSTLTPSITVHWYIVIVDASPTPAGVDHKVVLVALGDSYLHNTDTLILCHIAHFWYLSKLLKCI